MKIVTNVTFGSLKYGDVFKSDSGYFWMKIQKIEEYNAIALDDGEPGFFEENSESIIPLPHARLVID